MWKKNFFENVPHLSVKEILDLDWSVLLHLPYSPDLAPSDFQLFHYLENTLIYEKTFVENFLSSKAAEFHLRGKL